MSIGYDPTTDPFWDDPFADDQWATVSLTPPVSKEQKFDSSQWDQAGWSLLKATQNQGSGQGSGTGAGTTKTPINKANYQAPAPQSNGSYQGNPTTAQGDFSQAQQSILAVTMANVAPPVSPGNTTSTIQTDYTNAVAQIDAAQNSANAAINNVQLQNV